MTLFPNAEAKPAAGMVLHPDVREVDVSDAVLRIESDEKGTVSDGDVSWQIDLASTSLAVLGSGF
jgi:hypothetical protein